MTIRLLEKAMDESLQTQFLIDGFPRNHENQQNFVKMVGQGWLLSLFDARSLELRFRWLIRLGWTAILYCSSTALKKLWSNGCWEDRKEELMTILKLSRNDSGCVPKQTS